MFIKKFIIPYQTAGEPFVNGEFGGFIQRNGIKTSLLHAIELYIGGIFRIFPGIEGFFLRSVLYKMLFRNCGKNLLIFSGVYIIFSNKISVGNRVAINRGTYIDGRGTISIGDNVMIGPGCAIISCDHGIEDTTIPMYQQPITFAPITIMDDVYLGANVVVKAGVTIERGTVVGAGSVVTKSFPSYSIIGGIPAKIIGSRKIGS